MSRPVTRPRCVTCNKKFYSHRSDAHYCSGRCRQRATRARQAGADIDAQIEQARCHYWTLVVRKAAALGVPQSAVLTDEAQWVDETGEVRMHGPGLRGRIVVGQITPKRAGWAAWGLEAAGAPFMPPPHRPPWTAPFRVRARRERADAEKALPPTAEEAEALTRQLAAGLAKEGYTPKQIARAVGASTSTVHRDRRRRRRVSNDTISRKGQGKKVSNDTATPAAVIAAGIVATISLASDISSGRRRGAGSRRLQAEATGGT